MAWGTFQDISAFYEAIFLKLGPDLEIVFEADLPLWLMCIGDEIGIET